MSEIIGSVLKISSQVKKWFPVPKDGEVNFNSRIRPEKILLPPKIIKFLGRYIQKCLKDISGYSKKRLDGVVVGLSGGIDSSTIAALCKIAVRDTKYFVRGVILGRGPMGDRGEMSDFEYQDVKYALRFAKDMGIEYQYLDISGISNGIYDLFSGNDSWILSGVLPRIRSIILLQVADSLNAVCAGSTNGTELILSAFTVGGPAGHFIPLVDFYKSEVYKIAEMAGVPQYIRERRPIISELGLYDEQLYGASCYVIDPIIRRMNWQKKSPESVAEELGHNVDWLRKIKALRLVGEKGRRNPPLFMVCRRYKKEILPSIRWNRGGYFNNLFD